MTDTGPFHVETRTTPLFAVPRVRRSDREDGRIVLRSEEDIGDHPPTVVHSLRAWAAEDPEHLLVGERSGNAWATVSYGEAAATAASIGQGLLDQGLGPDRPLMILSGNSRRHLMLMLGAMMAGVPVAPVSVAYSLQSKDHARIRELAGLVKPGAVFAEDPRLFGQALGVLPEVVPAVDYEALAATLPGAGLEEAFAGLDEGTVAKILFTSGSTGAPKGVLTTHGMLAVNQQMMRQVWPFLQVERPVIMDWLPWSHTFGGNHNVGMMLTNGGTIYIDEGRPTPALFERTLANLREVPPTIYLNVPAGFAQLVPVLESDEEFARAFCSRLRLLFNAAAALPSALRDRLIDVTERVTGRPVPVTGSWGLTETAPAATNAHFPTSDARAIGVPLPGVELLLVPSEDAYEIRVRGPMVTPGYFARPDLTAESFDGEGFYRTGDAVEMVDPRDPNQGLLFRGRLAEDFKLGTGTFVRVGAVRTSLLSAVPVLADAVIVGEGCDCVGALAWLNGAETRSLLGREPEPAEVVVDDELAAHLASALREHSKGVGSAGRIDRLLVMGRPAGLDDGEITDKGYVNQRRVTVLRGHLVQMLYSDPPQPGVILREKAE